MFKPSDNLTRAECAKIIIASLGIKNMVEGDFFNDVSQNDWYYTYTALAYQEGIFLGDDAGNFRPQDNITRQDLALIMARVLQKYYGLPMYEKGKESINFYDSHEISDYAVIGIESVLKYGLMRGMPGNKFSPRGSTTRAESATVMFRLMFLQSD